jgi:uncharacterized membrane protein YqjE
MAFRDDRQRMILMMFARKTASIRNSGTAPALSTLVVEFPEDESMSDIQTQRSNVEAPPPLPQVDGTVTTLVTGILDDAQKLVRQQIEMLKVEVTEDLHRSKRAAEFGGIGVVLLTVGILGLVTAIAYFLHDEFQLAMWVSWAIISGVIILIGIVLAFTSYTLLERINPVPNKTLHALRENLQWKTT